ncbi:uncharacterized protein BX664DRAFT_311483 [Halteromyces radiatus]|uniref:uncharacterized protein n=1 Tax=Halteromyces radiatus TaxID=101107 RepID=UPI00221FC609|nr:uncharacterized protein BX664DRAFT_311483 [Halteromyces radiatus]KAI8096547.1 hypothetical protein BX664DRAFT_311483 [Halteromyces radiatus]
MSSLDPNGTVLIDPSYWHTYSIILPTTTSLSMASTLTVIICQSIMSYFQAVEINRVTLRLITLACAVELVHGAFRLAMYIPANTRACTACAFFVGLTDVTSPCVLAMVGVHSVCVLVIHVHEPLKLEKYYYIVIFIYSVVVNIVTIWSNLSPYPETYHCW